MANEKKKTRTGHKKRLRLGNDGHVLGLFVDDPIGMLRERREVCGIIRDEQPIETQFSRWFVGSPNTSAISVDIKHVEHDSERQRASHHDEIQESGFRWLRPRHFLVRAGYASGLGCFGGAAALDAAHDGMDEVVDSLDELQPSRNPEERHEQHHRKEVLAIG